MILDKKRLEKKAEKARIVLGITPEELNTLQNEAYGLYQYIGGDIPPENKRGTCRRSVIIEVVLDAGRLEMSLEENHKMTPGLKKCFGSGKYQELIDAVGPAFLYKEYEVMGEPVNW